MFSGMLGPPLTMPLGMISMIPSNMQLRTGQISGYNNQTVTASWASTHM